MQNGRHFWATAGHFEALLQMMARQLRGRISEWQTKGARPRVFMMDALTISGPVRRHFGAEGKRLRATVAVFVDAV